MILAAPIVSAGFSPFKQVEGVFYRAVDVNHLDDAIGGSRSAGRYSAADQPTLYLSSTPEGVKAAMIAHAHSRSASLQLVRIQVEADRIFDLRDEEARRILDIDIDDATAPWQEIVAAGLKPSSWLVREKIGEAGGVGLIDPSRKAPGLWHLVLFAWNADHVARVSVLPD